MVPVQLVCEPTTPPAVVRRNISQALRRGFRSADVLPDRAGTLTVIASGPSALAAPLHRTPALALNNALALFARAGLQPTYWAGCDPSPVLVDYLSVGHGATSYYLASKCHPAAFDAVEEITPQGPILWHLADDADDMLTGQSLVKGGGSVTLRALELFRMSGWTDFEIWGWDCCLFGDKHHAFADQPTPPDHIEIQAGDRVYATTTTWAAEAEDALYQLQRANYHVTIHGGGMVGAILAAYRLPNVTIGEAS